MFLGSFDLARIVGSPLGMAAQVSPAAKAAQMSPANQVFGAVTGGDAIQNALSSLPAQQALSSSPGIDFNNPVRGAAQGAVSGGILENKLGLEFLKNIFDRGNLESPPMPQQRVIQNAPMQQFNNPYEMTPGNQPDVRLEGLLGGVPAPSFPGQISDGERNFIVQQQMQGRLANEGLKAFPGAISDQERLRIMQPMQPMQPISGQISDQERLRIMQMQPQPMGLLGRY
tara:strand:+ start:90 stop:773 length:684 start_codon:yes stop_codon:yes gene_type:complete